MGLPEWSINPLVIQKQIGKLFVVQNLQTKALLLLLRYHIRKLEDGSLYHKEMVDIHTKLEKSRYVKNTKTD